MGRKGMPQEVMPPVMTMHCTLIHAYIIHVPPDPCITCSKVHVICTSVAFKCIIHVHRILHVHVYICTCIVYVLGIYLLYFVIIFFSNQVSVFVCVH